MATAFVRQRTTELPAMLGRQRAGYGGEALARDGLDELQQRTVELSPCSRAWGMLSSLEYMEAVEETHVRDYAPRFASLALHVDERSDAYRET